MTTPKSLALAAVIVCTFSGSVFAQSRGGRPPSERPSARPEARESEHRGVEESRTAVSREALEQIQRGASQHGAGSEVRRAAETTSEGRPVTQRPVADSAVGSASEAALRERLSTTGRYVSEGISQLDTTVFDRPHWREHPELLRIVTGHMDRSGSMNTEQIIINEVATKLAERFSQTREQGLERMRSLGVLGGRLSNARIQLTLSPELMAEQLRLEPTGELRAEILRNLEQETQNDPAPIIDEETARLVFESPSWQNHPELLTLAIAPVPRSQGLEMRNQLLSLDMTTVSSDVERAFGEEAGNSFSAMLHNVERSEHYISLEKLGKKLSADSMNGTLALSPEQTVLMLQHIFGSIQKLGGDMIIGNLSLNPSLISNEDFALLADCLMAGSTSAQGPEAYLNAMIDITSQRRGTPQRESRDTVCGLFRNPALAAAPSIFNLCAPRRAFGL